MRFITPTLHALAVLGSSLALPAAASLLRGESDGGEEERKLDTVDQYEYECQFEIESSNFILSEYEVRHWKSCVMGAIAEPSGGNGTRALHPITDSDYDHDLEPVLISQVEHVPDGGGRRLRRSAICRKCERSRRRRLEESDEDYERRLLDADEAHSDYMSSCLQSTDDLLPAFASVTHYAIISCDQVQVSTGEGDEPELLTIGDGAEPDQFCQTRLINTDTFMDGEASMAAYDKCFIDMYNCYHEVLDIQLQASEITGQHYSFSSVRNLRRLEHEESVNTVDTKKQICDKNGDVAPQCPNDRRLHRNHQDDVCPDYTGDVPPLQDWICDCLKDTGLPAFSQDMTCLIDCAAPVLTQSEFSANIATFQHNFKEQQELEKQIYEDNVEYEKEVFESVLGHLEQEYELEKMTACGGLIDEVCHVRSWDTMLRVYELGGSYEKYKGRYVPTKCRQLGDPTKPNVGDSEVKQGVQVRFPKNAEFTDYDFKDKVDKCENDWNYGEPECNLEEKSEVEFFVYVHNNAENMRASDEFEELYLQGNIMQTIEDYRNAPHDNKPDLEYCYFKYEVNCNCASLQA